MCSLSSVLGSGGSSWGSEGPLSALLSAVGGVLTGRSDVEGLSELDSRSMWGSYGVSSVEVADEANSFLSCEHRAAENHVRPFR